MVAMPKLHRKLFRDVWAAKAQFGAVSFIVLLGVAMFIASYAAYENLDSSYEGTYERLSMADYWISVDYIPQRAAREMDEIPAWWQRVALLGMCPLIWPRRAASG